MLSLWPNGNLSGAYPSEAIGMIEWRHAYQPGQHMTVSLVSCSTLVSLEIEYRQYSLAVHNKVIKLACTVMTMSSKCLGRAVCLHWLDTKTQLF